MKSNIKPDISYIICLYQPINEWIIPLLEFKKENEANKAIEPVICFAKNRYWDGDIYIILRKKKVLYQDVKIEELLKLKIYDRDILRH